MNNYESELLARTMEAMHIELEDLKYEKAKLQRERDSLQAEFRRALGHMTCYIIKYTAAKAQMDLLRHKAKFATCLFHLRLVFMIEAVKFHAQE